MLCRRVRFRRDDVRDLRSCALHLCSCALHLFVHDRELCGGDRDLVRASDGLFATVCRVVGVVRRGRISGEAFRLIGGSGEKWYQGDTLPAPPRPSSPLPAPPRPSPPNRHRWRDLHRHRDCLEGGRQRSRPALAAVDGDGWVGRAGGDEVRVCRQRCDGEEGRVSEGRESSHAMQGLRPPHPPVETGTARGRAAAGCVHRCRDCSGARCLVTHPLGRLGAFASWPCGGRAVAET